LKVEKQQEEIATDLGLFAIDEQMEEEEEEEEEVRIVREPDWSKN
jgi:hypothetical protein